MSTLPQQRPAVAGLPAYVAGRKATGEQVAALASNESHYPTAAEGAGSDRRCVRPGESLPRHGYRRRCATGSPTYAGVSPTSVAVGPGSVGVLAQLIAAVCDPGDEVVFAWRSFEAYPILCQIAGAEAVRVPLVAERHDLRAMAAAVTDRTRVVLLCSPEQPDRHVHLRALNSSTSSTGCPAASSSCSTRPTGSSSAASRPMR